MRIDPDRPIILIIKMVKMVNCQEDFPSLIKKNPCNDRITLKKHFPAINVVPDKIPWKKGLFFFNVRD